MFKMRIFLQTILFTLLLSSLSWATTFAQSIEPMSCSIDLDIKLLSAECASAPNWWRWSSEQILHLGIAERVCCIGGGDACSMNCGTRRMSTDELGEFTLETTDGITVSTTLLTAGLECYSDPLITTSQPLSSGQYTLTGTGPYGYFNIEIVDETIILEQLPSESSQEPVAAQVEGYVWVDLDEDGLRDEDEPGAADVRVDLINVCWILPGLSREYRIQTVTSDSEGFFQFTNVSPEMYNDFYSYALRFSQEEAYTQPNRGDDETRDSDAIDSCEDYWLLQNDYYYGDLCIIGTTNEFQVSSGDIFRGIDAGILQTDSPIYSPAYSSIYLPIISNSELFPSDLTIQTEKPTIRVNDFAISPRREVLVPIEASDLNELDAAVIEITYDPEILSIRQCEANPDEVFEAGECNQEPETNSIRVFVASTLGVSGDAKLAEITFQPKRFVGERSTLDIEIVSIENLDGVPLEADVADGVITNLDSWGSSCHQWDQIPQGECLALVDLYYGDTEFFDTNMYGSWLDTGRPCSRGRVRCQNGHVTELDLRPNITYYTEYGYEYSVIERLGYLSPAIGSFPFLETLILTGGSLTNLPPEIGNLSNLSEFDISNNHLGALPPEIGNLSNLRVLDLNDSHNLSSLPPEIGNLSNLNELHISNNRLDALPAEIGNLSSLNTLSLNNSKFDSLPSEIGNLSNLNELHVNNSRLDSLPPEIGNLSRLRELHVNNNRLDSLPPEIGNLSDLSELRASNNCLDMVPDEIDSLANLRILDLRNNLFATIRYHDDDTPTNISAEIQPDGAVWLQWTPIDREPFYREGYSSHYEIRIPCTDTDTSYTTAGTINSGYLLTDLLPDTTYKIQIRTYIPTLFYHMGSSDRSEWWWEVTNEFWSNYSNVVTVTTPASADILGVAPSFNCDDVHEVSTSECEALVALYYNTDGPNWIEKDGWLETVTPCSWKGVICSNVFGMDGHGESCLNQVCNDFSMIDVDSGLYAVADLRLNANGLTGTIPPEIGYLYGLRYLDVSANQLVGIASEISTLSHLEALTFDHNPLLVIDTDLQAFLDEKANAWTDTQ